MSPTIRYDSDNVDPAPLGKPLHFSFSGRSAPNRFLKGAMTERISSWDPKNLEARGVPSENLVNVYRRWGEGIVGLILSGNIMIDFSQLEAAGNPIIPPTAQPSEDDERFRRFAAMAQQGKAHGSLMVGQVSHPGRQVEERIQKDPVSASDVQLEGNVMGMTFAKPHAASVEEIKKIVNDFAHAAAYLERAGWDGIQLHGAHGYLLAQFLSPTTNRRTDAYGGSLANRARIILEIAEAVRARTRPDFVLGIKLNSVEFQDKGFEPAEARELCAQLEQHRFDFVELSGGTYESLAFQHKRDSTKAREAFFLEFAEAIAPVLKETKTYVTGGFKTVGAMVKALDVVDGVGLARPLAQEPHLAKDILEGKVKGAIKQQLDDNDFGITNVAAGTHIRQVGKDHEPIDLSREENVKTFMQDMKTWSDKMGKDSEFNSYGYVDIDSTTPVPYGTAASA